MTVHWCATRPVKGIGIGVLEVAGHFVMQWLPDVAGDPDGPGISAYDPEALRAAIHAGDVVISTLGPDDDVGLAAHCVEKRAHFICASPHSPAMEALDSIARSSGVVLMSEAGLAPGFDHVLAHQLLAAYRDDEDYDASNVITFTSLTGRLPLASNAFRAKFSSPPTDLLRGLLSHSRSIRAFTELDVAQPWKAATSFEAPLPQPESFEAYPTGDCLALMKTYGFDPAWQIRGATHGTLQLNGWAAAWEPIFAKLETMRGADAAARVAELAEELARDHPFGADEADRVLIFVSLKAEDAGLPVWHRSWVVEIHGDLRGTAAQRGEELGLGLAGVAVLAREISAGLHQAPRDPRLVARWLEAMRHHARLLHQVDHLKRN